MKRVGSSGFSDHAGEVHYVISGTQSIIEGDINGDGIADFQIALTGKHALVASDFLL